MFHVPGRNIKSLPGSILVSISLLGPDIEYVIKILTFNSGTFKQIPVKQCPPLLVIPIIWNHLEGQTENNNDFPKNLFPPHY